LPSTRASCPCPCSCFCSCSCSCSSFAGCLRLLLLHHFVSVQRTLSRGAVRQRTILAQPSSKSPPLPNQLPLPKAFLFQTGLQPSLRLHSLCMASAPAPPTSSEAVPPSSPSPSNAHSNCQEWRQKALLKSPMVRFMVDAIGRAGCPLSAPDIQCQCCTGAVGGGFDPATRRVILCENGLQGAAHAETTLVHELVHAFDDCRAKVSPAFCPLRKCNILYKVDWNNCVHHACSEIRAANLSGDCAFWQEVRRRASIRP
jgi:hypothetical protein